MSWVNKKTRMLRTQTKALNGTDYHVNTALSFLTLVAKALYNVHHEKGFIFKGLPLVLVILHAT